MGRDVAARLFAIVGAFLALYSVSIWSLSQGGNAISSVPGLDPRAPVVSAYFAIIFIGILLCLASLLAIVHARATSDTADGRFPAVWLGTTKFKDPKALSARLYVAFLFTVTLLVPAASLVHLNGKLADGPLWNEALPAATSLQVACALPGFWPFGTCSVEEKAKTAVLRALEIKDSQKAGQARLWLANRQCDLHWHMEMAGPQVAARVKAGGDILSGKEQAARDQLKFQGSTEAGVILPLATRLDADLSKPVFCTGPNNQSAVCSKDEQCRGNEWLPLLSPLLVIVTTMAGWLSFAWLVLVELLGARLRPRKSIRENGNAE